MGKNGKAIFADQHNESPIQILKGSMKVFAAKELKGFEDGTPMVSFALNHGKGSGSQVMPVSEYRPYIETLRQRWDEGLSSVEPAALTPAEIASRTMCYHKDIIRDDDGKPVKNEDGSIQTDDTVYVSWRSRDGKGAKPAKVEQDEFVTVLELLESTVDSVEAAATEDLSAADGPSAEELADAGLGDDDLLSDNNE